jgi:hypothetical protein
MQKMLQTFAWRAIKTRFFDPIRPQISHASAFYFEGIAWNSRRLTAIAFADNERASYFSKMAYGEPPIKKDLGKPAYGKLKSLIQNLMPDIVFVDTHSVFSKFLLADDFFVLPYLQSSLDISGSLDSVLQRAEKAKTTKKKIGRLSKKKLTCRLTRDYDAVHDFYCSMYVPRILERHREDAKLVSFEECFRLSQMGMLMLLMSDDAIISGAVCVPTGKVLYIPLIGTNLANQRTKRIAGFATTYFLIKWSKEQGFKQIDYGGAKPFLRDGAFAYKRGWGMSVTPMRTSDARLCALKFCNFGDAVKDFLQKNPFVFIEDKKLYSLILSVLPGEDIQECNVPGISGVVNLTNHSDPLLSSAQSKTPTPEILNNSAALRRLQSDLKGTCISLSYFDLHGPEHQSIS